MMRYSTLFLALFAASSAGNQPNIVVLVIDDVGWADVSYNGGDFPTPNLDALMRNGVKLDRYYVQPVCSPTRSAIMSGKWPHKTGMQHFTTLMPTSEAHLPTIKEGTWTMAELLKQQGYSTHAIGKWHLGYSKWEYTPTGRGFDSHTGYLQGAIDYYKHTVGMSVLSNKIKGVDGLDFWQNRTAFEGTNGTYSVNYYEAAHTAILDNYHPDAPDAKPLFIYYAHESIHEPLQVPPAARGAEEPCRHVNATEARNTLCQMMSVLDSSVGGFVHDLKAKGMWENTVIWVTTDNGGMTAFTGGGVGSASSNWPLRAGKTTLFEGGVRGVSFITGGLVPEAVRGTTREDLLHAVDIAPSLVPLGQSRSGPALNLSTMDGLDMWEAIITGKPGPQRDDLPVNVNPHCGLCNIGDLLNNQTTNTSAHPLVPHYSAHIMKVGTSLMKLIVGAAGPLYDGWWHNGDYDWEHAAANDTNTRLHLFDITVDPSERHNLAETQPDVVSKIMDRMDAVRKEGFRTPQFQMVHARGLPKFHDNTWAPWQLELS